MKSFSKTCGAAFLTFVAVIMLIALAAILALITHPVIAALGFAAMFGSVIVCLTQIRNIKFEPFLGIHKN